MLQVSMTLPPLQFAAKGPFLTFLWRKEVQVGRESRVWFLTLGFSVLSNWHGLSGIYFSGYAISLLTASINCKRKCIIQEDTCVIETNICNYPWMKLTF